MTRAEEKFVETLPALRKALLKVIALGELRSGEHRMEFSDDLLEETLALVRAAEGPPFNPASPARLLNLLGTQHTKRVSKAAGQ